VACLLARGENIAPSGPAPIQANLEQAILFCFNGFKPVF
jgi:hypothetical protein